MSGSVCVKIGVSRRAFHCSRKASIRSRLTEPAPVNSCKPPASGRRERSLPCGRDYASTSKICLTFVEVAFKITGSELEGYPSGQRDQTVNLTALPSKVRILLPPPRKAALMSVSVCSAVGNGFAGVAQW